MPDRYELRDEDVEQIDKAVTYTLMFEEQGISKDELFLRDAEAMARLFHNITVIYGKEWADRLLDIVSNALEEMPGFDELHEAFLLTLDVKRGLANTPETDG